ncbi:MAG: PrgI family protein [Peptococcaceae bacterium]|jgi:hypothetical protein|nr:PrgI family protein [Peptococcaceae bacterium]
MKSYRMPVSLTEEDKVFGGVLSARQFISLVGGFLAGSAVALALPSGFWPGVLKVVFMALFAGVGAALSFVRVTARGLRLDQYLVLRFLSRQETRDYPYRGFDVPVVTEEVREKGGLLARLAAKTGWKEKLGRRPALPRRGGHPRRDA